MRQLAAHCPSPPFLPIEPGEKGPTTADWPNKGRSLEIIESKLRLLPTMNVGLLLGPKTNLIDIEGDGPAADESRRLLFGGNAPETLSFRSAKGRHDLYQYNPRFSHLPATIRDAYPDLELRIGTAAAQTAIPPSVTGDYRREWLTDCPVSVLPDDVVERIAGLRRPKATTVADPFLDETAVNLSLVFPALAALKPNRIDSYNDWFTVAAALHSLGEEWFPVFDAWSKQSSKYGETSTLWGNLKQRDNGITINSLFRLANEDGWQLQRPTANDNIFSVLTSSQLDEGDYEVEYLIRDMLVAGQPMLVAGTSKTLKTSKCIDAGVSLASGTPFLGRFPVLRRCRVLVMSGESGLGTLQETARRVCKARGLRLRDLDDLIWSDELPSLDDPAELEQLSRTLKQLSINVLFVDPAYLCLGGEEHGNVFMQGKLLRRIGKVCSDGGATLILVHHNRKGVSKSKEPPQLEDMAMAGFAEFARQWWLLGRREKFRPGSPHELWLNAGGSAGHSGLYQVDIDEGHRSEGRIWQVEIVDHYAAKAADDRQQLATDQQAILTALANGGLTLSAIETATKINRAALKAILPAMVESKSILAGDVPSKRWKNRTEQGYLKAS